MGPSINPTVVTLAPGQSEQIRAGGAEIFMREIQGANEIKISLDDGELLPIAAGEGFAAVHSKFRVKNHNAVTVIVTVYQSTEAGVYIDRRDSATSVAIGGEFAVVNSAIEDEGGRIIKIGSSTYNVHYDHRYDAGAYYEVISQAANIQGVYLRARSRVVISTAPAAEGSTFLQTLGHSGSYPLYMWVKETGVSEIAHTIYLPPGVGIRWRVAAGVAARLHLNYDIL